MGYNYHAKKRSKLLEKGISEKRVLHYDIKIHLHNFPSDQKENFPSNPAYEKQ